jgi:hypothetical protein
MSHLRCLPHEAGNLAPTEDFIQWLCSTGAKIFESLFSEFIQPSGPGIGVNLLVPKLLAQFLKPVGNFMDLLRLQFLNGRFDFLNRARSSTLIQPLPHRNGLFSTRSSVSA